MARKETKPDNVDVSAPKSLDANVKRPPRKNRTYPGNSLRFYREQFGWTQNEIIDAINTQFGKSFARDTYRKIENRERELTQEWADRVGHVLSIPREFLGFSDDIDRYYWAVSPIPVIGILSPQLSVDLTLPPTRRIGRALAKPGYRAIHIGPQSLRDVEGFDFIFDEDAAEKVSAKVFERQEQNRKFVIRLDDGSLWLRKLVQGARRHLYHLDSHDRPSINDVEVECVYEVVDFSLPGKDVPDVL